MKKTNINLANIAVATIFLCLLLLVLGIIWNGSANFYKIVGSIALCILFPSIAITLIKQKPQ